MLPCFSDWRKVVPQNPNMSASHSASAVQSDTNLEKAAVSKFEIMAKRQSEYEVYQAIGVGCFGAASIYISQHISSRMFTVLRLIDLEILSASQLEDVQDEMKISQLLNHCNIVKYLCSFVVGTKLWAMQPLMHYGSCADIMHSAQPFRNGFQEAVIAVILKDIVSGLDYLHSLGFVHRSIRAKHFLIHEDGVVKLSGLRSITSMIEEGARVKALHGHFSGTVDNICWLAPEVLAQDLNGYSFQSDMYSVGIAALELATGEAPFAGLPVTEIMMLKLRGHPPILMKKNNEGKENQLSSQLSRVIDVCVDPDPLRRPTPFKLLNASLFKGRKKSLNQSSLKDLLLPVVPLDTSSLIAGSGRESGLESQFELMNRDDIWKWQ